MATEKRARLGRGLDALLGGAASHGEGGSLAEVSVATIDANPNQPRKTFDDDDLSALSDSIRTHGVLQPLVVRQIGDRYQLVAGERRLRAARNAGLAAVPVTVVDFNDQQAMEAALVENIQRADLNPIEKALGFRDYLTRYEMTHDQLAKRLGLGRATITNLVSLLELPSELQDSVRVGQLSTGHAKVLKGIPDPTRQMAVGKEIVARGLSGHATEAYIKQLAADEREPTPVAEMSNSEPAAVEDRESATEKTAHVQAVEDELRQKLGVRVEIQVKGKDRGKVVLSFETNDDFERIVECLRR
jgi:ParB family transcriptional regulator, chromosome partitioning protein